jgi:deoxyribodipyrimidine photo-lyase
VLDGLGIAPPVPSIELPAAGEAAARARLDRFLARAVAAYPDARDVPAVDGTSRLSYHLRWGALSGAEAVRRARAVAAKEPARRNGVRVWTRELAWRDFWAQLLHDHPAIARAGLRPLGIRWRHDDAALRRWQDGTTGVPLVDAGMRELRATGFMHNRVRMVTASFLTRHLLLDWRLGEAHFMAELLDGQLSQNGGNWQWVSGVGADAQPFHRIFSPLRQGERFDPDGAYVKRWVPELERVPAKLVHQPWEITPLERRGLCPDYPPPVIGLDEGRARALAAFEEARSRGNSR